MQYPFCYSRSLQLAEFIKAGSLPVGFDKLCLGKISCNIVNAYLILSPPPRLNGDSFATTTLLTDVASRDISDMHHRRHRPWSCNTLKVLSIAFTTPVPLPLHIRPTISTLTQGVFFDRPRLRRSVHLPLWRASGSQQPDRNTNAPDDDTLNSELQAKVKELFGSRNNVTIDIESDSGAQFIVRRGPGSTDYEQTRAAWAVIISIGVLSVAAGILFMFLYYTGAVHGSDPSEKRYEMPAYGSKAYIHPYQLLEEDRQLQDARAQ